MKLWVVTVKYLFCVRVSTDEPDVLVCFYSANSAPF